LQYASQPSGAWQWEPIPRNPRSGAYLWSKAKSEHFYIVWREETRRRYEKAGSTPAQALEAKRRKEFELAGQAVLGKKITRLPRHGITVSAAVDDFLEFIHAKKRPNTFKRYRAVIAHFQLFVKPGTLLHTITASDLDATIRTFFYFLTKIRGLDIQNPAAELKKLAVAQVIVEAYEDEELKAFFKACKPEEKAIFKTFYYTGLRDQELAHLAWADI
jgi:integrase